MSDEELIARLHLPWPKDANVGEVTLPIWGLALTAEAADRIEALKDDRAKAVNALEKVQAFVLDLEPYADRGHTLFPPLREACETLAELKGEQP